MKNDFKKTRVVTRTEKAKQARKQAYLLGQLAYYKGEERFSPVELPSELKKSWRRGFRAARKSEE